MIEIRYRVRVKPATFGLDHAIGVDGIVRALNTIGEQTILLVELNDTELDVLDAE